MQKRIKYIGLDVHKKTISISIADGDREGEVYYYGTISNDMNQLEKIIRKLVSQNNELKFVYEAGPCGYHIYRYLTQRSIHCTVVAPALIPKKSGDRIKTDRRDSETLARLHRAGELTAVYVPTPEDEALRDLVRARGDVQKALRVAKQQLGAFLLRNNYVYTGKSNWTQSHFNWLSDIKMPHGAQQITLQEYIDTVQSCTTRLKRLTDQIENLSKQSSQNKVIKAFQAMRGISLIVATTIVAEIGDLKRFSHPEQLMAFLGLVPSEHSTGPKKKQGPITKTGNKHARKVLIEASHSYRFPARKSRAILKRQEGNTDRIQEIAWDAQLRLSGRYSRLVAKGKNNNLVKTAIAREMVGFIWAIAKEVPCRT